MKRVADAREEPVVIPIVVVALHVHVPLVVPAIEGGSLCAKYLLYHHPSKARADLRIESYSADKLP